MGGYLCTCNAAGCSGCSGGDFGTNEGDNQRSLGVQGKRTTIGDISLLLSLGHIGRQERRRRRKWKKFARKGEVRLMHCLQAQGVGRGISIYEGRDCYG
eukprot:SM000003S11107  [mRNA]  locus=s3:895622:896540:- [translate_table: standard]